MGRLTTPMPDGAFWCGRRVFLTGHTGFVGGWLALWLTELGAEVTGYALSPPTFPSFFDLCGLENRLIDCRGDIRDRAALKSALDDASPEIVLHLAAQPLVRAAYGDPLETISTNVMGTANLLEEVRVRSGVRAVINFTTDKVYHNQEWHWPYREKDPLGGDEPYSASKAACELVTQSFYNSYFSRNPDAAGLAVVRAGNIIGGGDWAADRLVPDAVRAFEAGRPLVIRRPAAVRPWQHVVEPARGVMLLAEQMVARRPASLESYNLGPDDANVVTVGRLAGEAAAVWGGSATVEATGDASIPEAGFLTLDSHKALAGLNWRTLWDFSTTLAQSIAWYRDVTAGGDPLALSLRQIADYSALAREHP